MFRQEKRDMSKFVNINNELVNLDHVSRITKEIREDGKNISYRLFNREDEYIGSVVRYHDIENQLVEHMIPAAPGTALIHPSDDLKDYETDAWFWAWPIMGWALCANGGLHPVDEEGVKDYEGNEAILHPSGHVVVPYGRMFRSINEYKEFLIIELKKKKSVEEEMKFSVTYFRSQE